MCLNLALVKDNLGDSAHLPTSYTQLFALLFVTQTFMEDSHVFIQGADCQLLSGFV